MIFLKIQPIHHNQEKSKHSQKVDPKDSFHQLGEYHLQFKKFIDCKKGFINKQQEGIVSVNAMGCRRTKITKLSPGENISQTQNPPVETSNTQTNQELSGQDYEVTGDVQVTTTANDGTSTSPSAATDIRVQPTENSTPVSNTPPNTREQEVQTQQLQQRKDITKRLARKLLTECNYFEYIKQTDPMVYDGIKSKIKGFHPAFHSITPEGLNSRLVFLQQCMRPGDTIPVIGTDGKPKYNSSVNTSFGAPPVLVLRVGDFYHTKIIPTGLQISYDPLVFDMNPEGIGVQPMIAKISLNFNFVGGQGINEPIDK